MLSKKHIQVQINESEFSKEKIHTMPMVNSGRIAEIMDM
jgi:hypothetical protein